MTSTLHPADRDTLRKAAADLGHPEAAVVVFNEDGDPSGELRAVDFYGSDGFWLTGLNSQGWVDTPYRRESTVWHILEDLWQSHLPAEQRYEIA